MLTATKIKTLAKKPGSSMSSDGGGLYFRKRKNSSSWVIRRTRNKIASFVTIGRFPEMSLAAARKELDKFGNHSAENMTVADLLDDWYEQNEKAWKRPKQMEGYIRRLTVDDPHLVAMNIHSVELMIVRQSLKKYARNHGNVAANRLMEILKQVFRHAVQVGYLKYSPIVDLTRKVVGGIEKIRERVLTDNEIRLVCSADHHAELFRFLLLTGQRIRESRDGNISEGIDCSSRQQITNPVAITGSRYHSKRRGFSIQCRKAGTRYSASRQRQPCRHT